MWSDNIIRISCDEITRSRKLIQLITRSRDLHHIRVRAASQLKFIAKKALSLPNHLSRKKPCNTMYRTNLHIDETVRGFISKFLKKLSVYLNDFSSAADKAYTCSPLFLWKHSKKSLPKVKTK